MLRKIVLGTAEWVGSLLDMGSALIHCCYFAAAAVIHINREILKKELLEIVKHIKLHSLMTYRSAAPWSVSSTTDHSTFSILYWSSSILSHLCSLSLLRVLAWASTNHLIDPKWNTELINMVLMWVCCSITCHLNQVLQAIRFLSYAAPLTDLFCHFWRGMQLS